jgi:hypothetical protein
MGSKYKFWFAAENYLCDNYMTEKFWIPLAYGSVPIVYGSPKTHSSVAPAPDSFIDVRDFDSVAALAAHLLRLDDDDDAYMRLHAWRQRPLSQLNPRFVALLNHSAPNRFKFVPKEPAAGAAADAGTGAHGQPIPMRSTPAEKWLCHAAAEILRRRAVGDRGGPGPPLASQAPCTDPAGAGLPPASGD